MLCSNLKYDVPTRSYWSTRWFSSTTHANLSPKGLVPGCPPCCAQLPHGTMLKDTNKKCNCSLIWYTICVVSGSLTQKKITIAMSLGPGATHRPRRRPRGRWGLVRGAQPALGRPCADRNLGRGDTFLKFFRILNFFRSLILW